MGHSAGAQESLDMLDGMLYLFDKPEQSSTEQGRAKLYYALCNVGFI